MSLRFAASPQEVAVLLRAMCARASAQASAQISAPAKTEETLVAPMLGELGLL